MPQSFQTENCSKLVLDLGNLSIKSSPQPKPKKSETKLIEGKKKDKGTKHKSKDQIKPISKQVVEQEKEKEKEPQEKQHDDVAESATKQKKVSEADFYDTYFVDLSAAQLFVLVPQEGGKDNKDHGDQKHHHHRQQGEHGHGNTTVTVVDDNRVVQLLEKLDINVTLYLRKVPTSDLAPTK